MALQPVRGTRDLRGAELKSFLDIVSAARATSQLYGFEEIETPIFEFTDVFSRTLGDASDIVTKEMYTFTDKSGDSLTLRPEGTASVMRSVISESLFREMPVKYFYQGPMFRHERPQKGRYRQFYQIGVELLGVPTPSADVEVISLAWNLFEKLGIQHLVQLELNSIGDTETRKNYRQALFNHFKKHESELSDDSKQRLEKNPLRILDSKSEQDKPFVATAPKMGDYMTPAAKEFFETLQKNLTALSIPFTLNDKLVRGLDYYCHTVFEFTTTSLGAQNAVLSGGRYDGLIETMGGPATPGVGWGGGIDRLALMSQKQFPEIAVFGVIPLAAENEAETLRLCHLLRQNGVAVEMPYSGNLSNRLKKLSRKNCLGAFVIGGDEESRGLLAFKNFTENKQYEISKNDLIQVLQKSKGLSLDLLKPLQKERST